MYTRIIGDIHAQIGDYHDFSLSKVEGPSIQVGDFGIGFAGSYWHDRVVKWQSDNPQHRFIRGNHDNPAKCKDMPGYIPDGRIENNVMYIGGAYSIDYKLRVPEVNWWVGEECSDEEFDYFIDIAKIAQPDVIISHDAPIHVTDSMFIKSGLAIGGYNAKSIPNRTNMRLQELFEAYQPKFWFFGHWHKTMQYKYGNTMFHCLGIHEYVDFNFETLTYKGETWQSGK